MTVDGALVYTESWSPGAMPWIGWSAAWMPAGEGAHTVSLWAADWTGVTGQRSATLWLDTVGPSLTLSRTLFGAAQIGVLGAIDLVGTVNDASGAREVRVAVGGQILAAALEGGDVWTAHWETGLSELPDGLSVPVLITATDLAGRETTLLATLLLDAVPPGAAGLTLAYTNSLGA